MNEDVMQWISVNDRLPEHMEDVVAFTDRKRCLIVKYNHHNLPFSDEPIGWCFRSWMMPYDAEQITHWMPLPKPPRDSDDSVFLMSNGRVSDGTERKVD